MAVATLRRLGPNARAILDWSVRLACAVYLIAFASQGDQVSETFSQFILSAVTLKYLFKGRAGSLDFALSIGLVYLFLMPCISMAFFGFYQFVFIVAMSVLVFDGFVAVGQGLDRTFSPDVRVTPRTTQMDFLIWGAFIFMLFINGFLFSNEGIARQFVFNMPFACSLILFEKFCRTARLRTIYLMIGLYMAAIAFYMSFYWSGYGRIVIGSYLLLPLLIAHHWRDIGLRVWPLVLLGPVAVYYANSVRDDAAALDNLHVGSVAAHMALTRQIYDNMDFSVPLGWGSYWDQWLLIFLQWVPQAVWTSKPVGIGREYVEVSGLQYVTLPGHSVAMGYAGELWFYLGPAAWVAGLITFATLTLTRLTLRALALGFIAPVIAFEVFLITYVWGGMASFGGRMAFMVAPMLLLLYLRRLKFDAGAPRTALR